MKRFFIFILTTIAFATVGCETSPDDTGNTPPTFTFEEGTDLNPTVKSKGGSITFKFTTNVEWSVASDKDWVKVTPESGTSTDNKFVAKVSKNTANMAREAVLTVSYGDTPSLEINITQEGAPSENEGDNGSNDDGNDNGSDNGDDDGEDYPNTVFEAMFPDNNQVWYNTPDMSKYDFSVEQPFDANITSNEFGACANGQCYSFFDIMFDADVTKVNMEAFSNSNLDIVYLPHSIKVIDQASFFGSANLKTVHIGAGIEDIAMGAFGDCDNLSKLYIRATTPPSLGDNNDFQNATIYVPAEAVSTYKSALGWSAYTIIGYDFAEGKEATDSDDSSNDDGNEGEGDGSDGSEGEGDSSDDTESTDKRFNQRVLLSKHTASWCTNCPAMSGIIKEFFSTYPDWADNYNLVECHSSNADSGTPEEDKAYSDASFIIFKHHNAAGYPELDVNLNSSYFAHNNPQFLSDMYSYFSKIIKPNGADVGISISTTGDSETVTATAVVMAAVEQEYKITAWLLEDNIRNNYQESATKEEDYIYRHALRDIASHYSYNNSTGEYSYDDLTGESLGVIKVDESVEKTFEFSISGTAWNPANMEILIIVSAKNSPQRWEVVNTALCPVNSSVSFEYMQ